LRMWEVKGLSLTYVSSTAMKAFTFLVWLMKISIPCVMVEAGIDWGIKLGKTSPQVAHVLKTRNLKSRSLNVTLRALMEVPVWRMTEAPISAVALMDT